MANGLPNGHVIDDVTWPSKVKLVTPIRLERNISKTTWARDFKFGMQLCKFVSGMPSRRTNNFPESGRGLGHVTPTIFGSTVGYSSDSLASCNKYWSRSWLKGNCTTAIRNSNRKWPVSPRSIIIAMFDVIGDEIASSAELSRRRSSYGFVIAFRTRSISLTRWLRANGRAQG